MAGDVRGPETAQYGILPAIAIYQVDLLILHGISHNSVDVQGLSTLVATHRSGGWDKTAGVIPELGINTISDARQEIWPCVVSTETMEAGFPFIARSR